MNLCEQMEAAWYEHEKTSHLNTGPSDWPYFNAGFQAALALIANPSEEMVEQCARALDHPSVYMGGASEQSKRNARVVLKAIGGE